MSGAGMSLLVRVDDHFGRFLGRTRAFPVSDSGNEVGVSECPGQRLRLQSLQFAHDGPH